jgi:hypothetical protein
MVLSVDFRLAGAGWADCTVHSGEQRAELTASYLSDALGNLILAAVAVLSGAHCISIGFDEEPGEYRWSLERAGNEDLVVKVLEFPELWGNKPNSQGSLLFECSCHPLEFAQAVQAAATRVLALHGLEGYREKWGDHAFPSKQLELLHEQVSAWQR